MANKKMRRVGVLIYLCIFDDGDYVANGFGDAPGVPDEDSMQEAVRDWADDHQDRHPESGRPHFFWIKVPSIQLGQDNVEFEVTPDAAGEGTT